MVPDLKIIFTEERMTPFDMYWSVNSSFRGQSNGFHLVKVEFHILSERNFSLHRYTS